MSSPSAPVDFRTSVRELRSAQKSRKGAPLYSLVVNRPLGRLFAAAAHQLGLTPNQVTAISAVFTFAGIITIAVAPPSWLTGVAVALLLMIGYALDAADGQLARLRGGGSLLGEWLDHVVDSVKIATLHLAVLIMAYRFFPGSHGWLLVPLVFGATYVVHFFGMLLTELLQRVHAAKIGGSQPAGQASWFMSVMKLPTDYGVLCAVFVLVGLPVVFMIVYSVMAVSNLGYTLLVLRRWAGQIKRLDATPVSSAPPKEAVHV